MGVRNDEVRTYGTEYYDDTIEYTLMTDIFWMDYAMFMNETSLIKVDVVYTEEMIIDAIMNGSHVDDVMVAFIILKLIGWHV